VGGLDSASLEKQLALSAAFGGAAGLAALTGASERVEVYSRKVFVGGLPPDIDEGTAAADAGFFSASLISDHPQSGVVIVSVCLCVYMYVCLSDDNFRKP